MSDTQKDLSPERQSTAKVWNRNLPKTLQRRYAKLDPRLRRLTKWMVFGGLLLFFIYLPLLEIPILDTPKSSFESVLFQPVAISVLLALGLNVVVGHAGMLDLGYVAFYAIGAYTMALMGTELEWDFWVILPFGMVFAMVAGLLLGLPTLRLRGDYLAIVTLGFGEIIRITARNTESLGGPQGISAIPHPPDFEFLPSIFGLDLPVFFTVTFGITDNVSYYWLTLFFIVLTIFFLARLERSRVGRAWVAIREDEDAAELMGVHTFKYKIWAFVIGAAIGGAGGVIYASKISSITPDTFSIIVSILILAAVVLGGAGSSKGVILGAVLVAYLPERFREVIPASVSESLPDGFQDLTQYRILVFGLALVIMMIYRPKGLWPPRRSPVIDAPAAPAVVEESREEGDELV